MMLLLAHKLSATKTHRTQRTTIVMYLYNVSRDGVAIVLIVSKIYCCRLDAFSSRLQTVAEVIASTATPAAANDSPVWTTARKVVSRLLLPLLLFLLQSYDSFYLLICSPCICLPVEIYIIRFTSSVRPKIALVIVSSALSLAASSAATFLS